MEHNLTISVSKDPRRGGIVECRNVSVREKLLTFLFGPLRKVTILVPGNTVSTVTISEAEGGGSK